MPSSPVIAVPLHLGAPLVEAHFVERPNRFLVRARLAAGPIVEAHLADPGRLLELLLPGTRLLLRPVDPEAPRRTRWTAVLVRTPDDAGWVSLDTGLPNRLVGAALEAGALPELEGWRLVRREAHVGRSRIDFLLERSPGRLLALEVKSVTLVEDDGVARFPDAVTARGARHVAELRRFVEEGGDAAILFLLQRDDASRIEAASAIDPAFAEALRRAAASGVRVLGRRCRVDPDGVSLGDPVPAAPV